MSARSDSEPKPAGGIREGAAGPEAVRYGKECADGRVAATAAEACDIEKGALEDDLCTKHQSVLSSDAPSRAANAADVVPKGISSGSTCTPDSSSPATKENVETQSLPQLEDYNLNLSWVVYMATFLFAATGHGICNAATASGISEEGSVVDVFRKAIASFGAMMAAFWGCQTLLGPRCRSQLIAFFAILSTTTYAITFAFYPRVAALVMIPFMMLGALIGMSWSQRGRFALAFTMLFAALQAVLTAIVSSLPLIQSKLPEAAQQFLVPALKTSYLGMAAEAVTLVWERMYRRPCNPHVLTATLMVALVSVETVGVVGLLATVDSENIWRNAAIFSIATIIMETNSRSGILVSLLYKLMGRTYRFSNAAHIFRWGKMWASYSWVCPASGFVVPALIFGLRVEGSNFTFLRWEPWVLLSIYVLQQVATDLIYVSLQHYIRPSPTLSQTAARCLVLGQATPLFGENKHVKDRGLSWAPKIPKEDEFEPAGFKVGRWTIRGEPLVFFFLFEFSRSVFSNSLRGRFCIYGTFFPSEVGTCD